MNVLTLLPLLFGFVYSSVEGGDTRNLVDYYFNYYNDGASCDREERSTLLNLLPDGLSEGLAFVIDIGFTCNSDSECITDLLFEVFQIGFSCSSCFSDFISDATFFCGSECFGIGLGENETFGQSTCRDCLEDSIGFSEIVFENCVGLDYIPDDEFDTCVGQLDVEDEFFDLPQTLQLRFNENCKGDQNPYLVQGANCLTSDIFINFTVEEDCADCLRDHAICIDEFCSLSCLFGDLSDCVGCVEETKCAADFNSCSGLNFYNVQDEDEEDYSGDDDRFYYYNGGNGVFDAIIAIFNDFFVNFIGEFINNLSIILFGE